MRLMRDERLSTGNRRYLPWASGKPGLQIQLEWIASLPASREAERLLVMAEIDANGRDPMLPALLTLLQWALEDVPGLDRDKSWARLTWEELMQLDLRGEPKAAILALLPCTNPEIEVPSELLGTCVDEAAAGIVALAASASCRLPRLNRR